MNGLKPKARSRETRRRIADPSRHPRCAGRRHPSLRRPRGRQLLSLKRSPGRKLLCSTGLPGFRTGRARPKGCARARIGLQPTAPAKRPRPRLLAAGEFCFARLQLSRPRLRAAPMFAVGIAAAVALRGLARAAPAESPAPLPTLPMQGRSAEGRSSASSSVSAAVASHPGSSGDARAVGAQPVPPRGAADGTSSGRRVRAGSRAEDALERCAAAAAAGAAAHAGAESAVLVQRTSRGASWMAQGRPRRDEPTAPAQRADGSGVGSCSRRRKLLMGLRELQPDG
jgi:hypothetical protein